MSSTKAKALLTAAGFPMQNYFEESFGSPKSSPALVSPESPAPAAPPSPTDEPSVEFSASGKAIACDSADTLLAATEQAGRSLTSGCRMGSCGVCKQPLAAGEVCYDVEPKGLSESDRAAGHVLACVAKPVGRVVLAL